MSTSKSNDRYYLVSEVTTENPQSLVVVRDGRASVVAGKDLRVFKGTRPDTVKHPSKVFELLTNDASHPVLERWIDELGASESFKRSKAQERKTKNMPEETKEEIRELKSKGLSCRKIAERYDVSKSFVASL